MLYRWLIALTLLLGGSQFTAKAGVLAQFKMGTNFGTIDLELFEQDKPATVANFIAYVKAGLWHDNVFHRWVPNFIIQGGSYRVEHRADLLTPLAPAGQPDNRTSITTFGNIPFEKDTNRFFSNVYGTIAMARVGNDTNSASASWFFNVRNNTTLDTQAGGYTVFGRMLRGTNALNRFQRPSGTTNVYLLSGTEIPVYSPDGINAFWLNVDITLLTAEIRRLPPNSVEIAWTSVAGLPNIVERSTVWPAVWQTVQTIDGTGARLTVTNAIGANFANYRVRVAYP